MTLSGYETVYYQPNPGNGGDSLIAHATFQLFKKLKINYQIIADWECFDPENKIVIYAGGGNVVRYYNTSKNFIMKCHPMARKLIILPHTIDNNEDLLKALGANVDIICREKVSYNHVKKNAAKANVMLMDDMAFSMNIKNTLSEKPISFLKALVLFLFYAIKSDKRLNTIPLLNKIIWNYSKLYAKLFLKFLNKHSERKTLNCFRTDVERTGIKLTKDNIDLSVRFGYGTNSELRASYASNRLLTFINKYNEIRTNRLHICIAGALLGKKVKFYPNNYFKCESVYQHSIKDRFPNVQWMKL